MPEAHYDAVVLGGGHHATIIAPYLARAGLSVGVFERAPHLGGGANTSEGPAPGYLMNNCSHWTRFYAHPAYRDFDLAEEGLRYVFPEGNEGMVFDDGSSFIGFSAYRVVDQATGRAGALAGRHRPHARADPPVLAPRRRHVPAPARPVRAALEARVPLAPLQRRRRRGVSPTRWSSCSTFPAA